MFKKKKKNKSLLYIIIFRIAQSAEALEYTDCFSAVPWTLQ